MKKKIIIGILLFIPFVSILFIIVFRMVLEPTNEEIIQKLREESYYSCKIEYIIKNSRGEQREEGNLYFSKEHGGRIDFGSDRTKFYKENEISIKDNISNREYIMDEEMDQFHSIAFMNNLLRFSIEEGSLKDGQEDWGDTQYIEFISDIFIGNNHFDKARVYINKKTKSPIGILIYDKEGKEKAKLTYKEFKREKKEID